MEEYILFIDETFKTSTNPYFCMAGICVKRNYYEKVITKEVNKLKNQYFSSCDVIFHYTKMNAKENEFEIFKDSQIRNNFWHDCSSTLKNLDFTTFGVYFDQNKISELFCNKEIKAYHIAFATLLENYLHYLMNTDGCGSICIESRTFKENFDLQRLYFNMVNNGSVYFSKLDFGKHLSSIGFTVKGDNCVGLQIADFLPSALLRKINGTKDFANLGSMYRKKLYYYNTELEDVFGMRKIL